MFVDDGVEEDEAAEGVEQEEANIATVKSGEWSGPSALEESSEHLGGSFQASVPKQRGAVEPGAKKKQSKKVKDVGGEVDGQEVKKRRKIEEGGGKKAKEQELGGSSEKGSFRSLPQ
eukprot:GILI01006728.1.p2 GENE.GILI01006728.1~~GILI01006728.1.p2  ORF type:complete len:117 (-),score=31.68 GILI01006728.1:3-353(-)